MRLAGATGAGGKHGDAADHALQGEGAGEEQAGAEAAGGQGVAADATEHDGVGDGHGHLAELGGGDRRGDGGGGNQVVPVTPRFVFSYDVAHRPMSLNAA